MQFVVFRLRTSASKRPKRREGERLLQALRQALCGTPVELLKLGPQLHQALPGRGVATFLVGPLQLGAPGGLIRLRQIPHNVLPLMPLAPLDERLAAKDVSYGFPESFTAVNNAEHPAGEAQPPLQQIAEELFDRCTVLRRCLSEAQHAFIALYRHSHADNHLLPGHVFAIDPDRDVSLLRQRTLLEGLQRLLNPFGEPATDRRLTGD